MRKLGKWPIRAAVLTFASVLFLAALYFYSSPPALHLPSGKEKKMIVVLKSNDVRTDFWRTVSAGARAAEKQLGAKVDIRGPLSQSDTELQIRLLEDAIREKPAAIVLAPTDSAKLEPVARKIRQAGIRLVVIDTPMENAGADSVITNRHAEAGRLAGLAMVSATGSHPAIALIGDYPDAEVGKQREAGALEALSLYPNGSIGTSYDGGTEEGAYRIVKGLLSSRRDLNGILALTEQGTLGAAKAIKEANRFGAIRLVGFDSSIYEIQLMEAGIVDAVIVQKPFTMGYLGVKTAAQLMNGKKADREIGIDSAIVTKDNMYSPDNQRLLFPYIEN